MCIYAVSQTCPNAMELLLKLSQFTWGNQYLTHDIKVPAAGKGSPCRGAQRKMGCTEVRQVNAQGEGLGSGLVPRSVRRESLNAYPLYHSICLSIKRCPTLTALVFSKKNFKGALNKLGAEQWSMTPLGTLECTQQVGDMQAIQSLHRLLFPEVSISRPGVMFHWRPLCFEHIDPALSAPAL